MATTFNNYTELVTYFQEPRTDYYETLLVNAHLIIAETNIKPQGVLARDLGLTAPQMSIVLKLLRGYQSLNTIYLNPTNANTSVGE